MCFVEQQYIVLNARPIYNPVKYDDWLLGMRKTSSVVNGDTFKHGG